MKPTQALEILFEAARQARLIYQDHVTVQQAYELLKKELESKKEMSEGEKKEK